VASTLITDKKLIETFKSHFDELDFHSQVKDNFSKWFEFLDSLTEFESDDFSLFEYATISKREKNEGRKDALENNEIWRNILFGSIEILKRYDLRENPTLHFRLSNNENIESKQLPDILEISKYYENALEFEKILYGSDPWYRDHFAHVIRVWLLGLYVIFEIGNDILYPDFGLFKDTEYKLFSKKELFAAFGIAALCHDLGYALEKIKKLNKKVSEILNSFGGVEWNQLNASFSLSRHSSAMSLLKLLSSKVTFHLRDSDTPPNPVDINREILRFISERERFNTIDSYRDINLGFFNSYRIYLRSQWKYHEKYFDSLEKYAHGFISALLLQRKLLYFKEGEFAIEEDYPFAVEEARQFALRREILRAISSHTCEGIYMINHLSIESLLFFLDELQEWGRPFFSDLYGGTIKNPKHDIYLNQYDSTIIDWEVHTNELSIFQALYWILNSSRNYINRFRPAPEAETRDFEFNWKIRWFFQDKEFNAVYHFDKVSSSIKIKNITDSKEYDITLYVEKLNTGAIKEVDAAVSEITNRDDFKNVL
jgi:hypothetical protein